jgi:hypothetical protein
MNGLTITNTPRGSRIPVSSVKGRCPGPLDDGGVDINFYLNLFCLICQQFKYNTLKRLKTIFCFSRSLAGAGFEPATSRL